eukprot:CAMPEP_0185846232 /NCGR_PEP_ID=MMETSP1354-20130828/1944_1 /TAXON_ID=708628 /ORGANISM="Erythrolobus madagascarensis, Strain CCMP3276" /LENGTH=261 /DNA_ID=CAMNT_0028546335 /DNA_START=1 /DNA_END=782 /DNA_ORIENTATION=+
MDHDERCDCAAARSSAWHTEGSGHVTEHLRSGSETLIVPIDLDESELRRIADDLAGAVLFGLKRFPSNPFHGCEHELERSGETATAGSGRWNDNGEGGIPFLANVVAERQGVNIMPVRKYALRNPLWKRKQFKVASDGCSYKGTRDSRNYTLEQKGNMGAFCATSSGGPYWNITRQSRLVASVAFEDPPVWNEQRDYYKGFKHGAVLIPGGPAMVLYSDGDYAELRMLKSKATVGVASRKLVSGRTCFGAEVNSLTEREGA